MIDIQIKISCQSGSFCNSGNTRTFRAEIFRKIVLVSMF